MEGNTEFIRIGKRVVCTKTTLKFIVYNTGEIYSINGKKKNYYLDKDGYPYIQCKVGKIRRNHKIHRLVAKIFIPNPDNKSEVNHKDGDKANFHINNLEWVTKSENMKHAIKLKLLTNCTLKGENHNTSKLTFKQVLEIRKRYLAGDISMKSLAYNFKCSVGSISDIVNNKKRITC